MEEKKMKPIVHHEDMKDMVYDKITQLWDEGGNSKRFVLHLIGAFYKGNATHYADDIRKYTNKCCLTDVRVSSTYEAVGIIKSNMKEVAINYFRCTSPTEQTPFDKLSDRIHLAVKSHRSDKLLSEIGYQMLLRWCSDHTEMLKEENNG